MKQMILKVDDDFTEFPKGLKLSTCGQLVDSRSYYNKILILVLSPYGTLELGDKFEEFELNWEVIAVEDEPLNLDEILPYMNDIPEYDEEGKDIGSYPFRDLSAIQTFTSHKWTI